MLLCYVFYPKAGSAAWQPQGGSLTHMAFRGGASSGASRGLAPTRAPHIHSTTPCHYILGIALPPDDGVAGMTGGRMGQATCSELSGGEIKHGAGLGVDSLPDTFFYKHVMEETGTYLGEGGEEEDVRSSEQAEKLHLFGGRSQWMHLVYSGRTGMSN